MDGHSKRAAGELGEILAIYFELPNRRALDILTYLEQQGLWIVDGPKVVTLEVQETFDPSNEWVPYKTVSIEELDERYGDLATRELSLVDPVPAAPAPTEPAPPSPRSPQRSGSPTPSTASQHPPRPA